MSCQLQQLAHYQGVNADGTVSFNCLQRPSTTNKKQFDSRVEEMAKEQQLKAKERSYPIL